MTEANKIFDYATGKKLRRTPEEPFRQLFEHILIDDLAYPKENIDIEFPIQGGAKKKAEKALISCQYLKHSRFFDIAKISKTKQLMKLGMGQNSDYHVCKLFEIPFNFHPSRISILRAPEYESGGSLDLLVI